MFHKFSRIIERVLKVLSGVCEATSGLNHWKTRVSKSSKKMVFR